MPALASLNRTFRDGTSISATATVPTNVADQIITLTGDLSDTDLIDPALSFRFSLWVFDAAQSEWRHSVGASWVGHPTNTERPSFTIAGASVACKQVRFELSVPVRMRVGANLSLDPIPVG